ncbi:MAG: tRNA (adenosine(37)-N6)-threonylcarbamoyltransferase complex ATPase subunit type 1 TsaE, partial [Planctomycetaceae bacterium]
ALGDAVEAGTVVALVGDLGAGKTRLVQAIAETMGVERDAVTSPTFVLIQEHHGRLPIYHFDAYRLRDVDEFLELGVEELLGGEGVCLIEWADRVSDALPEDVLRIDIRVTGESSRAFHLSAAGPCSAAVLERTRASLAV